MLLTETKIDQSIFRAYDIRGIFNQQLGQNEAYLIGKAFATILASHQINKIAVGMDGRLSSPILSQSLMNGILDSAIDIEFIGIGPSPMLYYAVHHLKLEAGIMVTGSHNPKDHNGFKFMFKNRVFYGDDILGLYHIIQKKEFIQTDKKGQKNNINILNSYVNMLVSTLDIHNNNIKIAWDPGNGAAGEVIEKLIQEIPGYHYSINIEIDGNFPNHHPDPTIRSNLDQLYGLMIDKNCDLGIAFDGDGDRIGVLDRNGKLISGDLLIAIYARQILANQPNASIVVDAKASDILVDDIKQNNGNPIIWKTGHSYIKAKLKETGALLAGEMSGHIFFADKYYGFDDAIYASIRLLNIISEKNFDEIINSFPPIFNTPELRIECNNKFDIVENIRTDIIREKENFKDVNFIDGIRVSYDYGWWLLRASNTQEVLSVRCEADNIQNLNIVKEQLNYFLLKYAQISI